jgi:hypothetical protein
MQATDCHHSGYKEALIVAINEKRVVRYPQKVSKKKKSTALLVAIQADNIMKLGIIINILMVFSKH